MPDTCWHQAVARGINETIRIIDDAPEQSDYHPYYSAAVCYPKATMTRAALEVGIRSLLLLNRVDCDPSQDLALLYCRIPDQTQRRLSVAFDDAVAIYGYDPENETTRYLSSLPDYLKESDNLRYQDGKVRNWDQQRQQSFIRVGRELNRYIACLLCPPPVVSDGPYTIRELINGRIKLATVYAVRYNRGQDPGNDKEWWNTDWTIAKRVREHGSYLAAFRAAYSAGFEIGNPRVNRVIQDVYESLRQDCDDPAKERNSCETWQIRPALRHVLNSLERK